MKVKKQLVYVFVMGIALLFGSCWGDDTDAEALQAATEPGFNYFLLALTWPNQFCLTKRCNPSVPSQYFTIHGLWPQFTPTKYPQHCSTTEQPTDDLFEQLRDEYDLLKYWPDLKNAQDFEASKNFWRYEWKKHGTCSSNKFTAREYFQRSIDLAKKYTHKISKALENRGVRPDGGKYRNLDIVNAVVEATGAVPLLSLTSGGKALAEIRLCVKADGVTLFDCETLTFAAPPVSSPSSSSSLSTSWVSSVLETVHNAAGLYNRAS